MKTLRIGITLDSRCLFVKNSQLMRVANNNFMFSQPELADL